jgi:hypothetical protein
MVSNMKIGRVVDTNLGAFWAVVWSLGMGVNEGKNELGESDKQTPKTRQKGV